METYISPCSVASSCIQDTKKEYPKPRMADEMDLPLGDEILLRTMEHRYY